MAGDTDFSQEVKERILFLLASEPLNSRELETRLGYPYPTIRKAVTQLVESKRVVKFDRRSRNGKYTVGTDDNVTIQAIPSISFKGQTVKMTEVYLDRGIETLADNASASILKAWATIAQSARRLEEGIPSNVLLGHINRQKAELASARMNLEHLVFMINQMIDNPKLWTLDNLSNYPSDPSWVEFLPHLEELYASFYGES